ncbi:MAG: O-methyltransferase [Anaerolineales bacterium]
MTVYNDALSKYTQELFAPEDKILSQIRERSAARGLPPISVKPEEGRFLQFLAAASGASHALEIGTLGGYSGTWICRGLPAHGKLITLEKESEHAVHAREHFALADLTDRVEVRVGDAHEILDTIGGESLFGFIFIDAEKAGYPAYLDWALPHLAPGGIVAAHNAYRRGSVIDPADPETDALALRRFNLQLAAAPGLISSIFPAGDGTAFGIKR